MKQLYAQGSCVNQLHSCVKHRPIDYPGRRWGGQTGCWHQEKTVGGTWEQQCLMRSTQIIQGAWIIQVLFSFRTSVPVSLHLLFPFTLPPVSASTLWSPINPATYYTIVNKSSYLLHYQVYSWQFFPYHAQEPRLFLTLSIITWDTLIFQRQTEINPVLNTSTHPHTHTPNHWLRNKGLLSCMFHFDSWKNKPA